MSRRRIVTLIGSGRFTGLSSYDVHTAIRALVENPGFDRTQAMRFLALRMAEDSLSGRDLAALEDNALSLLGTEAHEVISRWIDENPARRLLLDEHRGGGVRTGRSDGRNHKAHLYDLARRVGATVHLAEPVRTGPPHSPIFSIEASWTFEDIRTAAEGVEKTIRAAEHAAARNLAEKLGLPSAPDASTPATRSSPATAFAGGPAVSSKSLLMEAAQARKGAAATFAEAVASGPPHARRFSVEATFSHDGTRLTATGTGSTKKEAEQDASRSLLEQLSAS